MIQGSFSILQLDHDGISLLREGHLRPQIMRQLLPEWQIELDNCQPAKFPLLDLTNFDGEQPDDPVALRRHLLYQMDG